MKVVFVFTLMFGFGSFAHATMKEDKAMADWKKSIAEGHESVIKEKCGFAVPITLNKNLATPYLAAESDAAGKQCDEIVMTVSDMCSDEAYKPTITKKVKKISCGYAKGEATFKMSGSELQATISPESSNVGAKARKFLENSL